MAIFLSHASADLEVARAIAVWLKAETGADVFVSDIDPGAEWHREILLTVQACKLGIVLLTENSIGSTWVNFEIGAMLALGKTLIPLCAGEFRKAALPTTLSHLQGCDIDNPVDLANMMRRIDASLERPHRQGVRPVPPPVTVTPAKERLFKQRSEAAPAFTRIIQDALRHQQELCVAGIANTDFFGGSNPRINDTLKRALADGLRARFIFLDPSSPATLRRGLAERDRLRTHETIVGGIGTAAHVQRGHRDRLRIRLAQEVSCFLCFNNRELLFQPYLVSVTGTGTPTQLLYDDQLLRWMRLHFEALWGGALGAV